MYGFFSLITTLVLCARSQDSLLSVSGRWVLGVVSTLLDLRAAESRVIRHLKPPCCGEASRKPRILSWDRTQAIGSLKMASYRDVVDLCSSLSLVFFLQG